MLSRVHSSTLCGIDAALVEIEVQLLGSLRRFSMVGLPDGVVREAKERVRCAIENSGFPFPMGEVIVSLAPADLPKTGAAFDLAIGAAILASLGVLPPGVLDRKILLGELALDGTVKSARGALAAACLAKKLGFGILTARESAREAQLVDGVEIQTVESLAALAANQLPAPRLELPSPADSAELGAAERRADVPTFGDVVGQHAVKRALEIAAAGKHNVLLVGPPGSGKSMLAERLRCILPPAALEEQIEVVKIYSADLSGAGSFRPGAEFDRPYRSPHHTVSAIGLIGGGSFPMPGEVSLAHHGVLFLDELPHVRREALDALREPLETQRVVISRARQRLCFPADFMLIAAMNPCPCGKKGLGAGLCNCPQGQILRYRERISGPILDRIDLQLWVPQVSFQELATGAGEDPTPGMRRRIAAATERQRARTGGSLRPNARLRPKEVREHCAIGKGAEQMLTEAGKRFQLSARGYTRILKVARTIADLAGSREIGGGHLAEAISYRLGNDLEAM